MQNKFWRAVGTVGVIATLSGLFLNLAASPAMYPVLDVMFAGGFAMAMGSAVFIRK